MLLVSRRIGESVVISDDIEVQVVELKGKFVKLGFKYPHTVRVFRKELHDKISKKNEEAALSAQTIEEFIR